MHTIKKIYTSNKKVYETAFNNNLLCETPIISTAEPIYHRRWELLSFVHDLLEALSFWNIIYITELICRLTLRYPVAWAEI